MLDKRDVPKIESSRELKPNSCLISFGVPAVPALADDWFLASRNADDVFDVPQLIAMFASHGAMLSSSFNRANSFLKFFDRD